MTPREAEAIGDVADGRLQVPTGRDVPHVHDAGTFLPWLLTRGREGTGLKCVHMSQAG